MKLVKVFDELEIEQFSCGRPVDGVAPRRRLVTRRGELRPMQDRAEDTVAR